MRIARISLLLQYSRLMFLRSSSRVSVLVIDHEASSCPRNSHHSRDIDSSSRSNRAQDEISTVSYCGGAVPSRRRVARVLMRCVSSLARTR
jgi:hypothetical protein